MVKIQRCVTFLLILAGLSLSLINFIPQIQASSIQGTTTTMTNPTQLAYYYQEYGEQYMYEHWLGYDLTYCLDTASNCGIYSY